MKRLNETYLDAVTRMKGLKESLAYMVENESYRWISSYTYSLDPQPLRSERTLEKEQTTVQDSVLVILSINRGIILINVMPLLISQIDNSELPTQILNDDVFDNIVNDASKEPPAKHPDNGGENRDAQGRVKTTPNSIFYFILF